MLSLKNAADTFNKGLRCFFIVEAGTFAGDFTAFRLAAGLPDNRIFLISCLLSRMTRFLDFLAFFPDDRIFFCHFTSIVHV